MCFVISCLSHKYLVKRTGTPTSQMPTVESVPSRNSLGTKDDRATVLFNAAHKHYRPRAKSEVSNNVEYLDNNTTALNNVTVFVTTTQQNLNVTIHSQICLYQNSIEHKYASFSLCEFGATPERSKYCEGKFYDVIHSWLINWHLTKHECVTIKITS